MVRRIAVMLAPVALAALATGCGPVSADRAPRPAVARAAAGGWPARFVSLRFVPSRLRHVGPQPQIVLSDARTGAIIRRLLPESSNGMQVAGLSLDRSGNVWITYSRGPVYRNDTAGGDPRPGSCANQVAIWHPSSGRVTVFLRTRHNVLISGATLSPDGRLLGYAESGCATGYFNTYLRVTSLASGRSWTIGRGLARCHLITTPSWATDSRTLLVGYAPHVGRRYAGPQGTCSGVGDERLVEVPVTGAQAAIGGAVAAPDLGCQITSATGVAGGGAVAVEACGLSGPAWLLILDARLHKIARLALGRCTDGNEVDANRTGRSVLISAYLFCNPPGRPGPVTRLWRYDGGAPRLLATVPGGNLSFSDMTW